MIDEYWTFKIYGYHSDDLKPHARKYVVIVCDECSLYNSMSMNQYSHTGELCQSCAQIGTKRTNRSKLTTKQKSTMSKAKHEPKEPLPDGWKSKLSDITDNKASTTYLGSIAEVILSRIYDNVQVMPYGNIGFDVICNRDYKIDIKASAKGDKYGYWSFHIGKNQIADYFLCIAFNSREDLHNPVHLWLIPGHIVNHLTSLQISKSTIDKWQQYELSLDKLVACCDNLSDNAKEAT